MHKLAQHGDGGFSHFISCHITRLHWSFSKRFENLQKNDCSVGLFFSDYARRTIARVDRLERVFSRCCRPAQHFLFSVLSITLRWCVYAYWPCALGIAECTTVIAFVYSVGPKPIVYKKKILSSYLIVKNHLCSLDPFNWRGIGFEKGVFVITVLE